MVAMDGGRASKDTFLEIPLPKSTNLQKLKYADLGVLYVKDILSWGNTRHKLTIANFKALVIHGAVAK